MNKTNNSLATTLLEYLIVSNDNNINYNWLDLEIGSGDVIALNTNDKVYIRAKG